MADKYPQSITVWTASVRDGYGGFSYSAPVVVEGRWEERVEERQDAQGNIFISNAVVFFKDTDVAIKDYVYLGESTDPDPTLVDGAYDVKLWFKIPDLRGIRWDRRAVL